LGSRASRLRVFEGVLALPRERFEHPLTVVIDALHAIGRRSIGPLDAETVHGLPRGTKHIRSSIATGRWRERSEELDFGELVCLDRAIPELYTETNSNVPENPSISNVPVAQLDRALNCEFQWDGREQSKAPSISVRRSRSGGMRLHCGVRRRRRVSRRVRRFWLGPPIRLAYPVAGRGKGVSQSRYEPRVDASYGRLSRRRRPAAVSQVRFRLHMPDATGNAFLVMRRYEQTSTILTSNRPVEDWGKLLGDNAAVSAMLDRLLHHGHAIKCGPRSWRTKAGALDGLPTDDGTR